ncbi:Ig-like domain-containing protein [Yersinia aleksiciae]|uniref:Ig-like domain-containing protein n=1 Tax=Yersinia aleksiciae TaxID=263819 RepID=UPI001427AAF5|nr:Ig-like domain-containing protein [Yersinia aleksiciae]MDA5496952.1 Ig-like domain-containing protein [Yersinia aleksiciae]NIK98666.1 Ig domain-containing protein [Yersinia aleksiciae]WQC72415.1 Ig-like domain-containing protein [Yersinia aleksiciae]
MQGCSTDNSKLFGRAVVLEVALGCPDTIPAESERKALMAGTSKGFDFSPNTVTSDADDTKGYVENIVTNSDFTISFEGEVRKRDKLDQFGVGNFVKYYNDEVKAGRQPTIWVFMDYGPVTFAGYMVITALSSDGGSNDIVSLSTEFKVADSDTIDVQLAEEPVPVASVTITPATSTGAVGSTVQLTPNILPANATNKSGVYSSADTSKVTVNQSGLATRVAVGSSVVSFTTNDGTKVGSSTVTVTA